MVTTRRTGEECSSLPIALLILAVGSIVAMPLLTLANNALIATRTYGTTHDEQGAADAGAEDAIWRLRYGGLTSTLPTLPGFTTTYSLAQAVNGVTPSVTVTMQPTTLAQDDFESGGWNGGGGWLAGWTHTGASTITSSGGPHGGNRHAALNVKTSYVERTVNLSAQTGAHLQFWAKATGFQSKDVASLLVGPTGSLLTVKTWTNDDPQDSYQAYDIDLSTYPMVSPFSIAYSCDTSGQPTHLYIDDLVVYVPHYRISVAAGATTLTAVVAFQGANIVVQSWEYS